MMMIILGRCDVTPLVVTREVSCSVTLDINNLAGTHRRNLTKQRGWAHSACVYIKETRDFSQISRCARREGLGNFTRVILTFWDMGVRGSKPQKQARVLLLGLDGSGKTTLLYKLKYNESVMTVPTVGFNVETLNTDRSSLALTVWDVGGQKKMRPHWRHYYEDTAGLLFVVDSCDQKRLDEACKELHRVKESKFGTFMLVFTLGREKCLPAAIGGG